MKNPLLALSSFDPKLRLQALQELASSSNFPASSEAMNMHLHTFFSYSGENWSPSQVAYEMKKLGLYSAAICDFDVLEGLEEFLYACDLLSLRSAVAFESRVFFPEFADLEINSPGEPGVFYFMGMGFVKTPAAGTLAGKVFSEMLQQSHQRNRDLIDRISKHLTDLPFDYDNDVLPLTPAGNATERHIIQAYHDKALKHFGSEENALRFWAKVINEEYATLQKLLSDSNAFQEMLRSKLIKRGGIGYVQPTEKTFPNIDTVIDAILECDAIPMAAWLDGGLPGEQNPEKLLECLYSKRVDAVNVIPDRNWNFKDETVKKEKISELEKFLTIADKMELPVNIGTEGNKPGQRRVDDFEAEIMKKYQPLFLKGAQIICGHTLLLRYLDMSYCGTMAEDFAPKRKERNDFFASVGALPAPNQKTRDHLEELDKETGLAFFADCAKAEKWLY